MGCCQSVSDKGAVGGVSSSHDNLEAAEAAALVLGTASFTSKVEISISYPDFSKPLTLRYNFEQLQPLRLLICDVDTSARRPEDLDLTRQDYLGEADFLLSDLMTAPAQTLKLKLRGSRGRGRLLPPDCVAIVRGEELANTNAVVRLAFSATGLENKDRFSKSDPFLRVLKLRESGDWVPVLRTEVIDNNLNPAWRPIDVDIRQLCNADESRPLRIEVLDYESNGAHQFIGACDSSLQQLKTLAASPSPTLDLVNPKKSGQKGYHHSGVLSVREATVNARPSFLQYITGGCQISFMVAIDFTGSNGAPTQPNSLHYLSAAPTVYEQAIMAVGQVLEKYDADHRYPVFGFGAALPPSGAVSHCFSLAGPDSPEVEGINGILAAYRHVLPGLKLSGPTLFAPVINTAAAIAQQAATGPGLEYHVLLILTDGAIMDMSATMQAIVDASALPLSILIVGVGQADFSAMEVLDGDRQALRAGGRTAARDIVQFVPLKRTQQNGGPEAVARELLAEIPGQVVGYFHGLRRIQPGQQPATTPFML
ncbi:hypothetical protein N2152v2_004435 [Parachlorella kessleri]